MSHDELHTLLGAYVLGGLSDSDHRTFTEHLRTCAQCQQELGQVSGLPRLLSLTDTTMAYAAEPGPDAPDPARGAEATASSVGDLLEAGRRRRRRRRGWVMAAASVAAAAVFGLGAWVGPDLFDSPPPQSQRYTATAAEGSTAQVGIDLVKRGWGTQLDLSCENMPVGQEIELYVIDRSGRAVHAGSWLGTPSGYSKVTGATALKPDQIQSVEVRTASGTLLATAKT